MTELKDTSCSGAPASLWCITIGRRIYLRQRLKVVSFHAHVVGASATLDVTTRSTPIQKFLMNTNPVLGEAQQSNARVVDDRGERLVCRRSPSGNPIHCKCMLFTPMGERGKSLSLQKSTQHAQEEITLLGQSGILSRIAARGCGNWHTRCNHT